MHTDDKIIILFLENKLTEKERIEVQKHLADCAACTEKLADIYRLESGIKKARVPKISKELKKKVEEIVSKDSNITTKKIRSNSSILKLALTGVFTVIIITVYFFFFNYNNSPSKFRDLNKIENSIIIQPKNEALLTPDELNFKWKKVKKSVAYNFILYKDNGKLLWEKQSKKNSLMLPSSLKMEIDKKYLWRVEIIFPDNSKKRSKLYVFTYKKQ
ncbi:MAG TPA: zf-HC2 domain-containing protein [Ignavibacteria bacterium]|nr:zf-HC2 domain-containing protein [Ignavibacteria bacterium]